MSSSSTTTAKNYDGVVWVYDPMSSIYSLGQINAAKISQVAHLSPGESVLYVGVGTGDDALAAARAGARVTCIDLSPAMLKRAEARFIRTGLTGEFICADALEHHPAEGYDAVALNFFLNFFPEPSMRNALSRLVGLVKPGGKLMIADYAYPRGNWLLRLPQVIYWRITNVFFWAVSFGGLGALHPIYDYCGYFPGLNFETESVEYFRPLRVGPWAYYSICAKRLPD
jgi:ubiquinone/menaquinone biosynthesis C-methylase UbiE